MVSYEATRRRYRGKMASGYEAKRRVQQRWTQENEIVEEWLREYSWNRPRTIILDAPVGTGRFLRLYEKLGRASVTGVDSSEEMLALARRKRTDAEIGLGDVTNLGEYETMQFDVAVCVRFLDLVPQAAAHATVGELCRVTTDMIILTVRLGPRYVPKSNTATHDERKFRTLVTRLDWRVADERTIFDQGWRVMRLERRAL
jgi:ubiquinone/menaquinone biosynthesis C-methylase UbiE